MKSSACRSPIATRPSLSTAQDSVYALWASLPGDGVPGPLQFHLNDGHRLMLIPIGGFGWVVGNREVAQSGHSECFISITAGREAGVDELVQNAQRAGGEIVTEPAKQPWGYAGAFADMDGHVWQVTAASPPG